MYGIVLNNNLKMDADETMKKMADKGVQTRTFFYPMHLQPAFEKFPWFKKERSPVSENLYKYGVYLPSELTLTEEQMTKVVESLKEIIS